MSLIFDPLEAIVEPIFNCLEHIAFHLPEIIFSLYVLATLLFVIFVTGVIYSISGIAKFKWWTLLLFLVFAVFSFPFRIILNVQHFEFFFPSTEYQLAPWIIRAFASTGYFFPVLWIFLLWVIKIRKGVSFKSKGVNKITVYGLICILSLVTLSEEALYPPVLLLLSLSHGEQVASTVSPDGKRKIMVFYTQFQDYWYRFISQKNTLFPILARHIGTVSKGLPSRGQCWDFPKVRLKFLWSENSDIVSVWHKGKPVWAYQFSKNGQIDLDSEAYLQGTKESLLNHCCPIKN